MRSPSFKSIALGFVLTFLGHPAFAEEWRLVDQVRQPTRDSAFICQLWSATVYAPGEAVSCKVGNIFAVNLTAREVSYVGTDFQGLPNTKNERELKRSALSSALAGAGIARLEQLRSAQLDGMNAERTKAASEQKRAKYLAAFEDASTLETIQAFEIRYSDDDPDGLVARLAPVRAELLTRQYREAHAHATTAAKLADFIAEYQANDPDNLVPEARKRHRELEKREAFVKLEQEKAAAKAQRDADAKARADTRQQEIAARQASVEKDRQRLQYITKLQTKYAKRVVAESVDAQTAVAKFKIDCRQRDERVLPLMHVLFASIASFEQSGGELTFFLRSRGPQVRIYAEARNNGKRLGEPSLYYEINEWGELRPIAIRMEAVLNSCAGFQGPIWLMPGEPGYR